jgi:hypothetical protein
MRFDEGYEPTPKRRKTLPTMVRPLFQECDLEQSQSPSVNSNSTPKTLPSSSEITQMSSTETGSVCSKKRQYTHRRAKVLSDEQREADKNAKIICNNKREKFKSIREMIVGQNKWIQFRKNQILAGSLSIPEKRKTINAIQSMKTRIKNALEQEFQAAKIRHLEERAT